MIWNVEFDTTTWMWKPPPPLFGPPLQAFRHPEKSRTRLSDWHYCGESSWSKMLRITTQAKTFIPFIQYEDLLPDHNRIVYPESRVGIMLFPQQCGRVQDGNYLIPLLSIEFTSAANLLICVFVLSVKHAANESSSATKSSRSVDSVAKLQDNVYLATE